MNGSQATAAAPAHRGRAARGRFRILYVEANRDGTVGGSHRILHDLVLHLDRERYDPVVLFYQDNAYATRLRDAGIEVHLWEDASAAEEAVRRDGSPFAKLLDYGGAVLRRRALLHRLRIDILHLNNSIAQGNDDWLPAAWLKRIPCLVTAMGDAHPGLDPVHRWLALRFTRVICISRYLHDSLRDYGCPPDRLILVRAGIDLAAIRARTPRPREDVRAELDIPGSACVIAMVGNIREWKGQHLVVEALQRLQPGEREDLVVLFIGDVAPIHRDYERGLIEAVRDVGLEQNVRFLGHRDDVHDLFAASDIALHASVQPEPFGLVLVEALEAGLPVIAADQGGPGEVVTEGAGIRYRMGDAGALADALRQILKDPARRRGMGEAARRRVAEFDAATFAAGIQQVYAQVLEEA